MRNMSFIATTRQIINETKTVTRRLGWGFLKKDDLIFAVEKGQGLKKGEGVNRLKIIRVISAEPEYLNAITQEECIKEGFSDMTPEDFIKMFCKMNRIKDDPANVLVNRIEFKYTDYIS